MKPTKSVAGTGSMKERQMQRRCLAAGLAGLLIWGAAGCESSKTSDHAITVTPPSTVLVDGRGTVVLTATPANTNAATRLFLPLEWTVSNSALGRIEAAGGTEAVYVGYGGRGANAIVVRDRAMGEGVAAVYHEEAPAAVE